MSELLAGLDEATRGRGGLFVIGGDPGIGKTRVAIELAAHAERSGVAVVWSRCWEGGAPAFWPAKQLATALHALDGGRLLERVGSHRDHLRALLPEDGGPAEPRPALESEHERFFLFEAFTALLAAAAENRPLVLILDDLHWADLPSLILFRFVARALHTMPVLMVALHRTVDLGLSPEVLETIAAIAREGRVLTLRGLDRAETGRFLSELYAVTPPAPLIDDLHHRTDGTPFFLLELSRVLLAEGHLLSHGSLERIPVPAGVRAIIRRRIRALSGEAQSLLRAASVIGSGIDPGLLRDVDGRPPGTIAALVDEAVLADVLARDPATGERLEFAHELIRATLYADFEPSERSRLHLRVAQAIEAADRDRLDERLPAIAHHYRAAGGEGEESAIRFTLRAGERALRLLAFEEAATQFRAALDLLASRDGRDDERGEALLGLGEAERSAAHLTEARAAFERAAALAERRGDAVRLARAALGAGRGFGGIGYTTEADAGRIALLERAIDRLGESEASLRVRCLSHLAVELYFTPEAERRAGLAREAVALAEARGDAATRLVAFHGLHLATLGPDGVDDRWKAAIQIVRLANEVHDSEMAFRGHHFRIHTLLERGDLAGVDAEIAACAKLADELRQPVYHWCVLVFRAMRSLLEGALEEGAQHAQRALAFGQEAQIARAVEAFGSQMFVYHWARGTLREMEAPIKALSDEQTGVPGWRAALAFLYAEHERLDEARAELDLLAEHGFRDIPRDGSWIISIGLLALACHAVGDAARAATLYDLLLPYADHFAVFGGGDGCANSVSTALGALAATQGDLDRALDHFDRALELERGVGNQPFLALTLYETAATLRQRGAPADLARAHELLEECLAITERLGLESVKMRARALASAVEAPEPAPQPRTRQETAAVFRREGEFWTLEWAGTISRVRNRRGMAWIAQLLREPGREVHCTVLLGEGPLPDSGDAGEVLDSRAKDAYRKRLEDLREELAEAEGNNDIGRATKAREEIEVLGRQLSAAVGLGGRDRRQGSGVERARVRVTRSIRESIDRIRQQDPALGHHLSVSIRTGAFCQYTPDPNAPVDWQLD